MAGRSSFRDIDWDAPSGQRPITLREGVSALAVTAIVGLYVYAATSVPAGDPVLFGWPIGRLEWLWLFSFVALGHAMWPLASNPERGKRYLSRLRRNYVATAAGLYLLVFFLAGTIGPILMAPPEAAFTYGDLPPFGFSVDAQVADGCKNLVGDTCYGTLAHPLGTTEGGKDMLGLLVYGTRLVLEIAMVTGVIVVPLATFAGATAASFGGRIDDVITGIMDIERTVPALFVFLLVRAITGNGSVFFLVLIFGLINAGSVASVVRSRALDEVGKPYIRAARSAGASRWAIIRDHIVPNVSHVALTAAVLQIPILIVTEATLSYLKVGSFMPSPIMTTPPSLVSWGKLIARDIQVVSAVWWPVVFPILALFVTVLAINVFGEGLRQAFAPEAR
ncbi:MAG: ABC transporter permease [Halodesulfurarchaeum sp.]